MQVRLTCEDKITYCQLALDSLRDTGPGATDQDIQQRFTTELHENIKHFRF